MPSDIKSYEDDLAQSSTVDKDNYINNPDQGAKTSDEKLQNALINTPHPQMVIKNNTTGDTIPFPKHCIGIVGNLELLTLTMVVLLTQQIHLTIEQLQCSFIMIIIRKIFFLSTPFTLSLS